MGYIIFVATIFCIYMRPFKLPIWVFSTLGAMCVYSLNVVSLDNIALVWAITKPSTLALIGLILFSLASEKLGFFSHLASYIIPNTHCIHTWKFFVLLIILGSIVSMVFANDGAILVLTPLVLALFNKMDFSKQKHITPKIKFFASFSPLVVFLLLISFISDFASNVFIISNLTNIITAEMFKISFLHFAMMMALPQIFGIFVFIIIAWICFRQFLPHTLHFKPDTPLSDNVNSNPNSNHKPSKITLALCYILIIILFIGITLGQHYGIELYIFLFGISLIALIYAKALDLIQVKTLLKETPFSVVIFSFGLFVVVFGVKNAGFLDTMQIIFDSIDLAPLLMQIFSVGIFSSLGSSIINNLPMVLLGNLTLQSFELNSLHTQTLAFAHLLGCNIGSKLTPLGSLATLLFLLKLKIYNIKISLLQYIIFAFILVFFVLLVSLFGLWISVMIFY